MRNVIGKAVVISVGQDREMVSHFNGLDSIMG